MENSDVIYAAFFDELEKISSSFYGEDFGGASNSEKVPREAEKKEILKDRIAGGAIGGMLGIPIAAGEFGHPKGRLGKAFVYGTPAIGAALGAAMGPWYAKTPGMSDLSPDKAKLMSARGIKEYTQREGKKERTMGTVGGAVGGAISGAVLGDKLFGDLLTRRGKGKLGLVPVVAGSALGGAAGGWAGSRLNRTPPEYVEGGDE